MSGKLKSIFNLKLLLITCLMWTFIGKCFSQDEKFKALFIYNFTKYIEWPSIPSNDFKIAVLGNTTLLKELEGVALKMKVGQHPIVVTSANTSADINDCQIVFISQNKIAQLTNTVTLAKIKNILVITDSPNSSEHGSAINFVSKNGSLKFEISKSNIESEGLKVNSSLLLLGIEVK